MPQESLRIFRRYWTVPAFLTVGLWIYSGMEWPSMPRRMVIHKGMGGVPNGWAPRFWGLWGTALLEAAGFALFVLLVELHARGTIAFNGDKRGQYASGKWILWAVSIVWSLVFFGVQILLVGWNRS